MVRVTNSWTVPRWMLVSIFLICWIHLTAGKCQHYGHACLGAHGKKRTEGTVNMDSVPLLPRHPTPIPHDLSRLVNEDSSEEIRDASALQPKDHWVMDTPHSIGTRLPPRFVFAILTSRRNRG